MDILVKWPTLMFHIRKVERHRIRISGRKSVITTEGSRVLSQALQTLRQGRIISILFRIRKIPGSNFGPDTSYPDKIFSGFLLRLTANAEAVPISSELLTASLNRPQVNRTRPCRHVLESHLKTSDEPRLITSPLIHCSRSYSYSY
jgi:hypothetical protein